jgi:hypothetical protein
MMPSSYSFPAPEAPRRTKSSLQASNNAGKSAIVEPVEVSL